MQAFACYSDDSPLIGDPLISASESVIESMVRTAKTLASSNGWNVIESNLSRVTLKRIEHWHLPTSDAL